MIGDVLTSEDKKMIEQGLELAKTLRAEIARARRAGLDVSELEARLTEAETQLKKIHQVYVTKK